MRSLADGLEAASRAQVDADTDHDPGSGRPVSRANSAATAPAGAGLLGLAGVGHLVDGFAPIVLANYADYAALFLWLVAVPAAGGALTRAASVPTRAYQALSQHRTAPTAAPAQARAPARATPARAGAPLSAYTARSSSPPATTPAMPTV